jgi:hypothetical protein
VKFFENGAVLSEKKAKLLTQFNKEDFFNKKRVAGVGWKSAALKNRGRGSRREGFNFINVLPAAFAPILLVHCVECTA